MSQQRSNSVVVLPNEKRIVYSKCERKLICEPLAELHRLTSENDEVVLTAVYDAIEFLVANVTALLTSVEDRLNEFSIDEYRLTALNRLKAVKFDSPKDLQTPVLQLNKMTQQVEQPLTSTGASNAPAPKPSLNKSLTSVPRKKVPRKPQFCSGDMRDLEPGEVPNSNYVPPPPAPVCPVYCSVYPCDPSLMDVPFYLYNYITHPDDIHVEEEQWVLPHSNSNLPQFSVNSTRPTQSICELFRIAKENSKAPVNDSVKKTGRCAVEATPIFPAFPSTAESDVRKLYQKSRRKLGRQYRVKFTNDLAVLREQRNRWMKGGRLTTTGELVELVDAGCESESEPCATSDDQPAVTLVGPRPPDPPSRRPTLVGLGRALTNGEAPHTPSPLPSNWLDLEVDAIDEPSKRNDDVIKKGDGVVGKDDVVGSSFTDSAARPLAKKRKVRTEIVYEDTLQYEEYARYYAQLHSVNFPGCHDDATQAWQRRWFRYYRSAVKFVDLPDEFRTQNDGRTVAENETYCSGSRKATDDGLSTRERLELYYQQWRWKQVHEYNDYRRKYYCSQVDGDGVETYCKSGDVIGETTANERSTNFKPASWTNGVSYGSEPVVYTKNEST